MTHDGDPEDEAEFGQPPPPEDRLWRHPSELVGKSKSDQAGPVTFISRGNIGTRVWTVGAGSALIGAAATLAILAGLGTFDDPPVNTVVEQIQQARPKQPNASDLAIAQVAIPAVAQVTATGTGAATGGSAVIFRTDGHMITTADAIDGADTITVTFSDGQASGAHVIGVDRSTDIAVIKADREGLTSAVLGHSDDLQLGEPTIAIACTAGHPDAPTIGVGVISALEAHVPAGDNSLYGMIQTNITLNESGRSTGIGAVLIDSSGSVIGVMTGRPTITDTEIPMQFAIPIDFAKAVADELIATGQVSRPWLGVEGTDLSKRERDQLGRGGAKITVVAEDGPAMAAGIRPGDVIISVDGKPTDSMSALIVDLRSRKPNDVIALGYISNGETQVGLVTLATRSTTP